MTLTEINIREKKFHNELQSQKKGRFENVFYKAIYNINEDFFNYLNIPIYNWSKMKTGIIKTSSQIWQQGKQLDV